MAERVDPPAITRLRPELGALVESRGFTPLGPKSEWNGKYNVFTWMRRSWKCDVLLLGWRKGLVASYFLEAHWTVSRVGESDLTAAGINPAFVRRGVPGFDLPTRFPLLATAAEKKWCREILADAAFAIDWLDRCASASDALAELERPERNGPAVGTNAYAYVEQYVRAHAPAAVAFYFWSNIGAP